MNKSPINYLLAIALVAVLWVVFAVLMAPYLTESPNLADKDPADLAAELQVIFGAAALVTIICCCYWFYYGNLEKTAGELKKARQKWVMLLVLEIIVSVALTVAIVVKNMTQGIEGSWYAIYFGINALLSFIMFWLISYLMSPRTVKFIPFGR